jgi:hypothetical protein
LAVYDDGSGPQKRPFWHYIALAVLIVIGLIVVKNMLQGSGAGGLLSNHNCSSNPQWSWPKEQFKGMAAEASVCRSSGRSLETEKPKPYVQVVVHVDGTLADKAVVRDLQATIRVYRRSQSGKWTRVKQEDTPADNLQGKGTSSLVYDTDRRWSLPHVPTKVGVSLTLTTSNGKPATVRHTFVLP